MFVNVFYGDWHETDNYQNATLGNWCMAGYAIGALSSMFLGSKGVHFKYLFAAGFLFLGLSAVFMYFEVQSAGLYERMKYPVIIRTTGMMFLYALTAAYATQRMPYKYLSTWICVMLTVRMVLGPSIGGAIYSNVLQERQQHYIVRYAQNVDMLHPKPPPRLSRPCKECSIRKKASKRHLTWLPHPQRAYSGTSHAVCCKRDGWLDYIRLSVLHDICTYYSIS